MTDKQMKSIWRYFLKYVGIDKLQLLWFFMLIVLVPLLGTFLWNLKTVLDSIQLQNPSYKLPSIYDFWLAIASCFLILFLMKIFKLSFKEFAMSAISERYPVHEKEYRAVRLLDRLFEGIYYILSFITGYYISWDSDVLLPSLGGSGSARNIFNQYSFQEKLPCLKEFIMMQLGFYLAILIFQLKEKPKNDFIELFLHHFIAIFGISLAYIANYEKFIILITLIHDISDIVCCFVLTFGDTNRVKLTFSLYILLLLTWFYYRIWVFSNEILLPFSYKTTIEVYGIWAIRGMTHFLWVLNVYWYWLFLRMGFKFIKLFFSNENKIDKNLQYYDQ